VILFLLLALSGTGHCATVHASVQTIEIRLKGMEKKLPEFLSLDINQIEPRQAIENRPTESLARLTRAALPANTQEARDLILGTIEHPGPFRDTLLVVKGPTVNLLMLTPDRLLAVVKPERTFDAVRLSLHLFGAWKNYKPSERAMIRRMIK